MGLSTGFLDTELKFLVSDSSHNLSIMLSFLSYWIRSNKDADLANAVVLRMCEVVVAVVAVVFVVVVVAVVVAVVVVFAVVVFVVPVVVFVAVVVVFAVVVVVVAAVVVVVVVVVVYLKRLRIVLRCAKAGCGRRTSSS